MPNPIQFRRVMYAGRTPVPALPAGATARWDGSALTGSDGDLIGTFSDTIGTNHGTASGSARGTLKTGANGQNGLSVLRLDGVANWYSLASALGKSTFTCVAVIKRIGTEAIAIGTNGDFFPGFMRQASSVFVGNGSPPGGYASASNSTTGWQIMSAVWDANAAVHGLINAATTLSFGATTVYGAATMMNAIGRRGGNYGSQDIGEIIYWPSVLTAQELADAHANLNAKWGIY